MNKTIQIECEEDRKRPEGSEVERLCAKTNLARELLGWGPQHTLDEGLQATIDWIGDHIEYYRPETYTI